MTEEYALIVHPFMMGTDKDAANKVIEEASEAREAAQRCRCCNPSHCCCEYGCNGECGIYEDLSDELADVIQAACNLAARYGIDLSAAMRRCEGRNRQRRRYELGQASDEWA